VEHENRDKGRNLFERLREKVEVSKREKLKSKAAFDQRRTHLCVGFWVSSLEPSRDDSGDSVRSEEENVLRETEK